MTTSSSRFVLNLSLILVIALSWTLLRQKEQATLPVVDGFSASSGRRSSGAMARKKKATGFGLEQPKLTHQQAKDSRAKLSSNGIYSKPSLYDLAFGYRNFEEEISFLLHTHQIHTHSHLLPTKVLELAAGPARHCLTALTWNGSPSIVHATAIDISDEMKLYALDLARSCYQQQRTNDRPPFLILNDGTDSGGLAMGEEA